jgi:tetratricopeptide (TPR) repeat protein
MGDYDREISDCTKAIRLAPRLAKAYCNRGRACASKGEYDRAMADYTEAVRLTPKDAGANNRLAWFLATCPEKCLRDAQRAIAHAERACDLTKRKDGAYLDTPAAAYAEAGKFDKALEFQQKALELAMEAKENMRVRLKLYRDGKPYREPVKKRK